jgi:hypothetical protein
MNNNNNNNINDDHLEPFEVSNVIRPREQLKPIKFTMSQKQHPGQSN